MSVKGKRIVLTGGAGFIGTALTARLVDVNQVIIYDSLRRNSISSTELVMHPNVTFVRGDVRDPDALKNALRDCNIVIHLAAIAGVDTVLKDPVTTLTVNTIGTYYVLEAVRDNPSLERIVVFSSSEVFGANAFNVSEDGRTEQGRVGDARWTYAVSKLAAEHLAFAYHDRDGLPVVIVRPFNVYGPGQVGEGAIHNFVVRALRDEDLVVTGDGSQIRAWCYVDDLVDAVVLCLENPVAVGEVFNIGNPRSVTTIYDLAKRVIALSGARSHIVLQPIDYSDVLIRTPSIHKAQTLLGYQPQVELDEGIVRTLEWYARQTTTPR